MGKAQRKRLLKLQAKLASARGQARDEQVVLLQRIVSLDPMDGDSLIMLGEHYAEEGKLEKAEFYFERAEGIDEFEAEASLKHAQALVRAERYKDALPLLKQAQELNPREDVAQYIKQLERLAKLGT
jgi:tetratricopeptide (TPR) repeat protein